MKSYTKNINLKELKDEASMRKAAEEILVKMKNEDKTISEVIGLDEALLEQTYAYAYTQYNAGKYQDALSLFGFLTQMNPKSFKFLFGHGACLYKMKNYQWASLMFFMALHVDPNHVLTAYYLADCFVQENRPNEAIEALDLTIRLASTQKEFSHLLERAKLMRDKFKK